MPGLHNNGDMASASMVASMINDPEVIKAYQDISINFGLPFVGRSDCRQLCPDYYAGAFIDQVNSRLNVLIVGDVKIARREIYSICGSEAPICFLSVSTPYAQLKMTLDKIVDYVLYNPTDEISNIFVTAGIEIEKNVILVKLRDVSREVVTAFKERVADQPFVVIENVERGIMYD
jgi:hypothetical protein